MGCAPVGPGGREKHVNFSKAIVSASLLREQIYRACLHSLLTRESLFQREKEADVFERLIRKRY